MTLCASASAATPPVYVFPIPGSHVAPPAAQIVFRGTAPGRLGKITVVGSTSGSHAGTLRADSDGRGASFLPSRAFVPGEVVTVSTSLNILGVSHGSFRFTVATPAPPPPPTNFPPAPRTAGDVLQFHSRPDLTPAAVKVSVHPAGLGAPAGDIFLGPQQGPLQDGPMIVDQSGQLIWFKRLATNQFASDFRVQTFRGRRVLTWWQGVLTAGWGNGVDVINDSAYRQIAAVRGADGLNADLHEFQLTPQGTALITAYFPVYANTSSVPGGSSHQVVMDSVLQEIDISTGLLLFEWHSLDHVPFSDTYTPDFGGAYDHFHINSIERDRDGNLLISARNTSTVYKIGHRTGHVLWRLGGKRSSFMMGPGAAFGFQHDVRARADNDAEITLFDDHGGPPRPNGVNSRGLTLLLDTKSMVATVSPPQYTHTPALDANFEGNLQQLAGGGAFIGWGQQPYFSEYDAAGALILDGRFVPNTSHYRAYLFTWTGVPARPPAVTATNQGTHTDVYASWNGATSYASWRVLAGNSSGSLKAVATAPRTGFETRVTVARRSYLQVQALDGGDHVMASSAVVRSH